MSNLSSAFNSWVPFSHLKAFGSRDISHSNLASSFSYTCTSFKGVRKVIGSSIKEKYQLCSNYILLNHTQWYENKNTRKSKSIPFTFRFAEHFALAPWNETSPDWGTLQLYKVKVCLAPSSMISTSYRNKNNMYNIQKRYVWSWIQWSKKFLLLFFVNLYTGDWERTSPFSFHWPWTSSSESSTSKCAVSPSYSSTPYMGRTTLMSRAGKE